MVNLSVILFVNFGVKLDLWIIVGIFNDLVVIIIGIDINLFFENNRLGFFFFKILWVLRIFFNILNMFLVFFKEIYFFNLLFEIG